MTFEECIKQNGYLIFTNVGISMMPLLREGRDLMHIEAIKKDLKPFDIVLFRRPNIKGRGEYVLHRILKDYHDGTYFIMGDHDIKGERVKREDILGNLVSVKRDGKVIDCNSLSFKIFSYLIWLLFPFRWFFRQFRRAGSFAKRLLTKDVGTAKYTGLNKIFKLDSIENFKQKLKDGSIREVIDDWKWIFSYSLRYKWIVIFYTVLGIFSSTLALGASYLSALLINIITSGQKEKLFFLLACMLGSTAFSLVFSSLMSRISAKISIRVNNDIQAEIFDKIIDADWESLNKYKNGDILNRFNSDVGTISGNAINWIPNLIITIYSFIASFIVIIKMDWIMALISFISAPFLLAASKIIMGKLKKYKEKVQKMNSDMMAFEVDTFYNFDVIKSFGVSNHYSNELRGWQKIYKDFNLEYNKFEIRTNVLLTILGTAVSMTAFGYCLYRLWTGQILYGDMTFFLEQRSILSGRFNSLVSTFPAMLSSSVSAHRIRELVELPKEAHNEKALDAINEVKDKGLSLIMDDVSYAYDKVNNVYEKANFAARPNEIVAVLGSSGGGKTTMFRLLLGLIRPGDGHVVIEDYQGNRVDMNADLRTLISYVPQGNTAIMGSIADNLKMIKEDATEDEMINALKIACAWDFVEPLGLNNRLGEKGKGLSEGQVQRLSIARAMLRNAPILFLDEATSALDEETENMVLDNIMANCPNKTVVIATHRPSVLSRCDKVYKINNKDIVLDK